MKITIVESLTTKQRLYLNIVPEVYREELSKLSVEEQLECIYIRKVDYSGVEVLSESDPKLWSGGRMCLSLKQWGVIEVFVYHGMIIEVITKKGKRVTFGTVYKSEETNSYSYMDSHDHQVYSRTEDTTYNYYLLIYGKHELLQSAAQKHYGEHK